MDCTQPVPCFDPVFIILTLVLTVFSRLLKSRILHARGVGRKQNGTRAMAFIDKRWNETNGSGENSSTSCYVSLRIVTTIRGNETTYTIPRLEVSGWLQESKDLCNNFLDEGTWVAFRHFADDISSLEPELLLNFVDHRPTYLLCTVFLILGCVGFGSVSAGCFSCSAGQGVGSIVIALAVVILLPVLWTFGCTQIRKVASPGMEEESGRAAGLEGMEEARELYDAQAAQVMRRMQQVTALGRQGMLCCPYARVLTKSTTVFFGAGFGLMALLGLSSGAVISLSTGMALQDASTTLPSQLTAATCTLRLGAAHEWNVTAPVGSDSRFNYSCTASLEVRLPGTGTSGSGGATLHGLLNSLRDAPQEPLSAVCGGLLAQGSVVLGNQRLQGGVQAQGTPVSVPLNRSLPCSLHRSPAVYTRPGALPPFLYTRYSLQPRAAFQCNYDPLCPGVSFASPDGVAAAIRAEATSSIVVGVILLVCDVFALGCVLLMLRTLCVHRAVEQRVKQEFGANGLALAVRVGGEGGEQDGATHPGAAAGGDAAAPDAAAGASSGLLA